MNRLILTFTIILLSNLAYSQNRIISFSSNNLGKNKNILTDPELYYTESNSTQTKVSGNYHNALIKELNIPEGNYQFVTIKGYSNLKTIGKPSLPFKNELVAVGEGATITIKHSEFVEYSNYKIFPTQHPKSDAVGALPADFTINEITYNTNEFYPQNIVEITNTLKVRGSNLALVQVCPVQYNPVTKILRVYSKISYELNYSPITFSERLSKSSITYQKTFKNMVTNPDAIAKLESKKSGNDTTFENYIILAPIAYQRACDSLALWKRQLGYGVEVVLKEEWTSADIKKEISDRYWGYETTPDYFVIIGDHDGDYPMPAMTKSFSGETYLTDLYYACFDGKFDFHPDMAHGRISVRDPNEALRVVMKIVNYERTPVKDSSFYSNAVNCAMFQDDEYSTGGDGYAARRFCHTSEEVRSYLRIEHSYNIERIYYTFPETTPTNFNNGEYSNGEPIPDELLRENGFNWDGNANDIKNSINEGRFFVFHRDHGYLDGTGWGSPEFLSKGNNHPGHISSLKNGNKLPVVFSINCATGAFEFESCFAEEFLRHDGGGAVGVFAASTASQSGQNDAMSIGLFDAIWSEPGLDGVFGTGGTNNVSHEGHTSTKAMGDVLNQGLYRMSKTWEDDELTYGIFHWFGDPAMKIWTTDPHNNLLKVTHDSTIKNGSGYFEIAGLEIDRANITLMQGDKIIAKAKANSGTTSIFYTLINKEDIYLTISKENHHPYQAILKVDQPSNIPPYLRTIDVVKNTANEIILQGEIINNNSSEISQMGFQISSNSYFDINELVDTTITIENTQIGLFSYSPNILEPNSNYYFRAWAKNASGIAYGLSKKFNTGFNVVDTLSYLETFNLQNPNVILNSTLGADQWVFDNPMERPFKSSTSSNGFAAFENSNSEIKNNADLILPTFNFSKYESIVLSLEQYYLGNSESEASILYSIDNGPWKNIISWKDINLGTLERPSKFSRDLSYECAGQSNVRIKFNFKAGNAECWLIDDIAITGQKPQNLWVTTQSISNNATPIVTGLIVNNKQQTIKELGVIYSSLENCNLNSSEATKIISDSPITEGSYQVECTNLENDINYYIKTYAISEIDTVYGKEKSWFAPCSTQGLPYLQDFENTNYLPLCYTQQHLINSQNWQHGSGNGSIHPSKAHSGDNNMFIKTLNKKHNQTQISLPPFNLEAFDLVNLSFWLHNSENNALNDALKLSYYTPAKDEWKSIKYFSEAYNEWTNISVDLPNLSNGYKIAFEGINKDGHGICIDDIAVQPLYTLGFKIKNKAEALENIKITLSNDSTLFTNNDGLAVYNRLPNGNYKYTISAEGYNTLSDSVEIDFDHEVLNIELQPVSVAIQGKQIFKLFPNPASSTINIVLPETNQGKIEIIDVTGRTIYHTALPASNNFTIQTNNIKNGMYFVRISNHTGIYEQRIIIQQ